LIEEIQSLAPFGISNPEPSFYCSGGRIEGEPKIVGNGHLKLKIVQDSFIFDSIGFNMGKTLDIKNKNMDYEVIYSPYFDTWNGKKEIQLKIKGIREKQQ